MRSFIQAVKEGMAFPAPWPDQVESTQAAIRLDRNVWETIQS